MSDLKTTWYLGNTETQEQFSGLTLEYAKQKCAAIPATDVSFWHVWQEGWESWKELSEVEELKPSPIRKDRRFPRYDVRLRVIVRHNDKAFRTFSKVLSTGGICLEDPIPNYLLGECQIYISAPNLNLQFEIGPTEHNDRHAFTLVSATDESSQKLRDWLKEANPRRL